ncbi:Acetyltransferase (GNAT) domain [Friedmanniomyces endolithicus]|nr:Acetyltransferase (GNAT) domain [Friedmanniomyces endolithicus]
MADPADQVSITLATTDDIPHILAMIKELAAHEHALDSVEATETSLLHTLTFAPSPTSSQTPPTTPGYAKTLLLRLPSNPSKPTSTSTSTSTPIPSTPTTDVPGAIAGMALYFPNYSTWRSRPGLYLEDLYVRPAYRGRGYGHLLVRSLAREVLAMGGGRLEWSCLRWNEGSLRFYDGLGARRMEGWVGLRLEGVELGEVAEGRRMGGKGSVGGKVGGGGDEAAP